MSAPARPEPALPQAEMVTSVVTLLPAPTNTPAADGVTPQPNTSATVEPQGAPQLQLALTPDLPPTQPWQDCSLAGGWIGCDPNAPALAAHLAFFQPAGPAVVALDLESPTAWSIPSAVVAADPRLSWSPEAAYLLAALDESQMGVYAADGAPQGRLVLGQDEAPPAWQPDGQLAPPETVRSAQGAQARLEQAADQRWQVQYQNVPGAVEVAIPLENEPSDRLYHLVGFVPGANLLLGQTYFAGNQAMMQGAQLFTLDLETGQRRDLEVLAPLGWQASYAWRPAAVDGQLSGLAFADTGGPQVGLPTLTLVDFNTGELRRPLPQGVAVADLAWQPLGGQLAFAASPVGEVTPPDAALYALPAIYLFSPQSGEVRSLTQPPAGARDGLPAWTADGQWLLYARYFESGALEVHALQMEGAQDRLILAGLTAECPLDGPACPWGRWLSISSK